MRSLLSDLREISKLPENAYDLMSHSYWLILAFGLLLPPFLIEINLPQLPMFPEYFVILFTGVLLFILLSIASQTKPRLILLSILVTVWLISLGWLINEFLFKSAIKIFDISGAVTVQVMISCLIIWVSQRKDLKLSSKTRILLFVLCFVLIIVVCVTETAKGLSLSSTSLGIYAGVLLFWSLMVILGSLINEGYINLIRSVSLIFFFSFLFWLLFARDGSARMAAFILIGYTIIVDILLIWKGKKNPKQVLFPFMFDKVD